MQLDAIRVTVPVVKIFPNIEHFGLEESRQPSFVPPPLQAADVTVLSASLPGQVVSNQPVPLLPGQAPAEGV